VAKDPNEKRRQKAEDDAELWRAVMLKRRATDFVKGNFWQKHLQPYINARVDALPKEGMWRPDSGHADIGTVALTSAFVSGAANEINNLLKEINVWIERGEDAEKTLRERGVEL